MQPSMNAFVERLNGTIRREALDHFLLFSRKQVKNIVAEFIEYYNFVVLVRLFYGIDQNNTKRIHQGINKIPDAEIDDIPGTIKKTQVLSGLHHHYYRSSA
jgi:transposase InsO family protein